MPESTAPRRPFKHYLRNWTSWAGLVLATAAVFAFLLLFAIDFMAGHRNPYVGILAYVVAPGFFLLGMVLVILGVVLQRRAERRAAKVAAPLVLKIDLSRPRDRRILAIFAATTVIFLFVTALGSYETYQYTESVQFCGQTCHSMDPEFVASEHFAHAKVECVACHVGPGAAAYFNTKLNGVKQLYHTIANDFSARFTSTTPTRVRPRRICEQCHWPKRYVGNVERTYNISCRTKKTLRSLCVSCSGSAAANRPMVRKAAFIFT